MVAHWTQEPTKESAPSSSSGKLEIERRFTPPSQARRVATKVGHVPRPRSSRSRPPAASRSTRRSRRTSSRPSSRPTGSTGSGSSTTARRRAGAQPLRAHVPARRLAAEVSTPRPALAPRQAAARRASAPATPGSTTARSPPPRRRWPPATSPPSPTTTARSRPCSPIPHRRSARACSTCAGRHVDAAWVRGRAEAAAARARARSAARRLHRPCAFPRRGRRAARGSSSTSTRTPPSSCSTAPPPPRSGGRASTTCSPASSAAASRSRTSGCAASAASAPRGGEALRGDPPAEIVIAEDEARFEVDVRAGQKTGFFLDQRDNRRTIRRHAAGATVLNVFSYTGGFSLHAALGGAAHVTSVDIAGARDCGARAQRRPLRPDADAHELVAADAFDFFARAAKRGRRWDLVIVDPPSFAPSEKARPAALAAYRKLAPRALDVGRPRRSLRAGLLLEPRDRGRSARADVRDLPDHLA